MNRNFVKTVLSKGGSITPLLINSKDSNGLGLMNPSVFIDNGKVMMILRNVNYTLYHCEKEQTFNNRWGPLAYLNPENDKHLRTWNFLCQLNPSTLVIDKYWRIDTTQFDKEPLWEFVGLEDARLVRWNGSLYSIGVRRDTTTNGQGRMEFSQIYVDGNKVKEIARHRIEPPNDPNSYCEKNWMPILDKPFHFVKWSNPTEVVKVDLKTNTSQTVYLGKSTIPDLPFLRGSSQIISWDKYYICLVHDCDLVHNKAGQKDATYMHRFIVWDLDWNIIKITDPFSFMGGEIEFCCGMTKYNDDILITFGFQDNAAFILRMPNTMFAEILGVGEGFSWVGLDKNIAFKNWVHKEVFIDNTYERVFEVEENDIVLDIGASVGPFTYKILDKHPSKVLCFEPEPTLFETLVKNVGGNEAVTCYKACVTNREGIHQALTLYDIDAGTFARKPVECDCIDFRNLMKELGHIDFLKSDCEGAEYDIFTPENFEWIKANVRKIVFEAHLWGPQMKGKFIEFRDLYLKEFVQFKVFTVEGIDITNEIWDPSFVNNYNYIMIYIDNRVV